MNNERENEIAKLREDILLHLVAHRAHQVRFETDRNTTELNILRAFHGRGVHDVRRALQELESRNFITRRVQYAVGYNEPKPVFLLTTAGRLHAKKILSGDGQGTV
jgi:hypothetical protein